jgi:hypothetical protein
VQVKANPEGESFVIFNNGEANIVEGMSGACALLMMTVVVVVVWSARLNPSVD